MRGPNFKGYSQLTDLLRPPSGSDPSLPGWGPRRVRIPLSTAHFGGAQKYAGSMRLIARVGERPEVEICSRVAVRERTSAWSVAHFDELFAIMQPALDFGNERLKPCKQNTVSAVA
jgi:hypothetical protein